MVGLMRSTLRETFLRKGHLRILIAVAPYIFSGQYLIPDAGSRVATIDVIQVIAVAAERVAEFRLPRQLNGGAAGNEERSTPTPSRTGGEVLFHDVQDIVRTRDNAIPHLLLVGMVTRISRMLGIAAVRPSLHPADLRLGLISSDGIDKERQPRLVGSTNAGVMARLLEGDIIVFAISERLAEGDGIFDETEALPDPPMKGRRWVRTDAMGVGGGVTHQKICVLRQGTTAIIKVVNLHFDAFGIAQRY